MRVDLIAIPYRGDAPAITDLLSARVQVYFGTVLGLLGHIKSGKLRALAVLSSKRLQQLPEIPTVSEFVPGYSASGWQGLGAPKNTPSNIIEMLNGAINAGLSNDELRTRLADLGGVPISMTSHDFDRFIAAETEKWGKVARAANIRAD